MKIARERKSSVLASNAVHHRIDSLTSIVALLAILGSHVLHSVSWLDPVGGLIVSIMVIRAGWGNTGNALLELSDVGVSEDIKDSVRRAAVGALFEDSSCGKFTGSQVDVQDIQGIKAGQNYLINVELSVPGNWSVKETRVVEDVVRARIGLRLRGVRRVGVRFVSKAEDIPKFSDEFISADVSPRSGLESEDWNAHNTIHGHTHDQNPGKVSNGDVGRRH